MNIKKFFKEFVRVYGGMILVVIDAILEILKLAIETMQEILQDTSKLINFKLNK